MVKFKRQQVTGKRRSIQKKDTSSLIYEWIKIKHLQRDGEATQFQYILLPVARSLLPFKN
ncbi:hypothetical protein ACX27_13860 [Nostoc piscinale CENA21]|uniref:Uncharacterized protein n=1 Tax=Nostoc piscinale CENA21 TaxID=224013 RepID=A0A0M4T2I6_9NOSO|nr:hypothetical protein [Nostoc piscinale]ALF53682.1 hypothetical protein ACX27_13860 [Nostoc piscinale CENA21]